MTREEHDATVIEVRPPPWTECGVIVLIWSLILDLCCQEIDNDEESSLSSDEEGGDAEETGQSQLLTRPAHSRRAVAVKADPVMCR